MVAASVVAQSTLPTTSPNFGGAQVAPNRAESIARPLRYRPDGTDFVIQDGEGHFNRPLYAARTSFRVDAGDRPEFALNLPRKGGVLRLGLAGPTPLWLHEAASVEMRYRPGSVIYTIRDPALGDATLTLTVMATRERGGALWQVRTDAPLPGPVVWSFAGGSKRSANARNGDIIAGRDPGEIMPPTLDEVTGNRLAPGQDRYINQAASFDFLMSPQGTTGVVDFADWPHVPRPTAWASADAAPAAPVFQGQITLTPGTSSLLGIFAGDDETAAFTAVDLSTLWSQTEAARAALVQRVTVDTPDPFINAVPGALLVAADALWQEPHVMHGAIAWRSPLLGWRGPAALDTLGWHDRFRAYARHWIAQQNVDPTDFPAPPTADPAKNLATDDWRALHGYGSIPARHYDMALGFVDLLLRHLMWTGDVDFAREVWPFLERHLEWEKRCFDRDGLYESYAAIWASDALTYNGGGTAHASAMNHWHRVMAARIAETIGEDPAPHTAEAARIHAAVMSRLWSHDAGLLAEYVERAGLRRPHLSSALWTFYHAVDSALLDHAQGQRMAEFLAVSRHRIPVQGKDVPDGGWMLSTTDWQPYEWSLNNVVPSENAHTALAFWQVGRPDLAWGMWQGTVLDAMYLSQSPGNIPNLSHYDVHRRETYRDFADPIGTFSRALVEGLFGVRPDGLSGTLTLAPGFPLEWDHASLRTPDLSWAFERSGRTERFRYRGKLAGMERVRLRLPARGARVVNLKVNGDSQPIPDLVDWYDARVWLEFEAGMLDDGLDVEVEWAGDLLPPLGLLLQANPDPVPGLAVIPGGATWEPVSLDTIRNDGVTRLFQQDYLSPRSPHVSLSLPKQGLGSWSDFKATAELDDSGLNGMLSINDGGEFWMPTEGNNVAFVSWWDNYPRELSVPLTGPAHHLLLLVAGSTSPMHSRIDNGEIVVAYTDGTTSVLPLHNPTTWWPIERDYVIDDYAFRRDASVPWRLELATGRFYQPDGYGGHPRGGAATVLSLPLDPTKPLQSLTVRALSTEVVVGLLAASLAR